MKFFVQPTRKELLFGLIYLVAQWTLLPYALSFLLYFIGEAAFQVIYFTVNFVALFFIFRSFLKESWIEFWDRPLEKAAFVAGGVGIYYVLSIAYSFMLVAFGWDTPNVNDSSIGELLLDAPVLMPLCVIALAPFAEELLYRALLFTPFGERCPIVGYILCIFLFSAAHVVSYIGLYPAKTLLLCALQYLPGSLTLTFIYAKSENIYVPMLVHAAVNSFSLLLFL